MYWREYATTRQFRNLKDVIRPGTTRGLDFVTLEELIKRTGITPKNVIKFALSEMLWNCLDKEDASEIRINLQAEGQFYKLVVSDNGGRKLEDEDEVRLIFDFENKGSSKRGILAVSRGYLGNALKCILGFSYALAEMKGLEPPPLIVRSAGHEFSITVNVDRINETAVPNVEKREIDDDGLTTFIVKIPRGLGEDIPSLKNAIYATSIVNPYRRITYNLLGEKGVLGSSEKFSPIKRETSILWYTRKQFQSLFKDFVKAKPDAKLSDFISIFRGFARRNTIFEVINELNKNNWAQGSIKKNHMEGHG